ncbi:TPA: hypothetical protein ACH3X3_010675 [Trebouxia sp. C0006]
MRLWCKARLAGCGHGAGHTLWQWQARKAWQQERVSKQQTGLGSLGGCPAAAAICIHHLRSEGSAQAWGGALQADMVMGQDGRSKGWGTHDFKVETEAD